MDNAGCLAHYKPLLSLGDIGCSVLTSDKRMLAVGKQTTSRRMSTASSAVLALLVVNHQPFLQKAIGDLLQMGDA